MGDRARIETQIDINVSAAETQIRRIAQQREAEQQRVTRLSQRTQEIINRIAAAERRVQTLRSQAISGARQIGQQIGQIAILESLHLGSSALGSAVQPLAQIVGTTAFAFASGGPAVGISAFVITSISQLVSQIRQMFQRIEAATNRIRQLETDQRDIRREIQRDRDERYERELENRELARIQAEQFIQETIWRTAQAMDASRN